MNKDQQEIKRFLEEQVDWCKNQDSILEKIEKKLYEIKKLAEYVLQHELTTLEVNKLNDQLNTLKQEIHSLEQQLQSVIH